MISSVGDEANGTDGEGHNGNIGEGDGGGAGDRGDGDGTGDGDGRGDGGGRCGSVSSGFQALPHKSALTITYIVNKNKRHHLS